jgi:aldose 1-epimerase
MADDERFGEVDGQPVRAFTLDGGAGVTARVTDYGARLTELHAPGRDGSSADIVLGFDSVDGYVASTAYFGATVGRHANRIAGGRLPLRGQSHQLDRNEGPHHLHGGSRGWDRYVWDAEPSGDGRRVTFRMTSPDGDMGYPGECRVSSTYELDGTRLRITMEAVPDATSVVNMVHHSYVNLAGHASGDVLAQLLRLDADAYVPVGADLIPTGEIRAVAGTPFDFRSLHPIGQRLAPPGVAGGEGVDYDHNWCLRGEPGVLHEAAEAYDLDSGRRLRLWTTERGVQMYAGGYLTDDVVGKGGQPYCRHGGFTLETQAFPNAPQMPQFPSAVVEAGQTYHHEMVLELTVD